MRMFFAFAGFTDTNMSYQHWPSQNPFAAESVVGKVPPLSVDLISDPPASLSKAAKTVVGALRLHPNLTTGKKNPDRFFAREKVGSVPAAAALAFVDR